MKDMDEKGVVLNAAFSASASFVFASRLAFTLVIEPTAAIPMISGKLVGGLTAVLLAWFIFRRAEKSKAQPTE